MLANQMIVYGLEHMILLSTIAINRDKTQCLISNKLEIHYYLENVPIADIASF